MSVVRNQAIEEIEPRDVGEKTPFASQKPQNAEDGLGPHPSLLTILQKNEGIAFEQILWQKLFGLCAI